MVLEIILSVILLFVGIGILMIIHACVVGRAFRGDSRPGFSIGLGGRGAAGLSPEDIRGLPCLEYNGSGGPVECTVCLDMLRQGDRCRILPGCGHCFHADCIDSWLTKTAVCPVCRAGIGGSAQDRF